MIKIIYGVEDNSSDCELIYPLKDNKGLLNLVGKIIIKSDVNEAVVGSNFYSIHCTGDYFVFSKVNIVYDKIRRVSYRAFMMAFASNETDHDVWEEINKLEQQYTNDKLVEQSTATDIGKGKKEKKKRAQGKKIVATYYSNEQELKDYFIINENYEQYEVIYFIDREYEGKTENPINALKKYDKVFKINELNKNIKPDTQNDNKKSKINETIKKNPKISLMITLFIGLFVGYLCFGDKQNSFPAENSVEDRIKNAKSKYDELKAAYDSLQLIIYEKNDSIKKLNDKIARLSPQTSTTVKPPSTEQSTDEGNSGNSSMKSTDINALKKEVEDFLKNSVQLKQMTISKIESQLQSFKYQGAENDNQTKSRIAYAIDFLTVLTNHNPVTAESLQQYCNSVSRLNENYELTKFYKHLKTNLLNDNCTPKLNTTLTQNDLQDINKKTLSEIEKHYGYNN